MRRSSRLAHKAPVIPRLRVVPRFSSGIVEGAKRERGCKSPATREKATRGVSPFLAWDDFHARSRFAPSTNPEEKWGTTRSLVIPAILSETNIALFTGWKFI